MNLKKKLCLTQVDFHFNFSRKFSFDYYILLFFATFLKSTSEAWLALLILFYAEKVEQRDQTQSRIKLKNHNCNLYFQSAA